MSIQSSRANSWYIVLAARPPSRGRSASIFLRESSEIPAGYGAQQAQVATPATLTPGETYYYRIVAENGTPPAAEGTVEPFTTTTAQVPLIESETTTVLAPTSETLEAEINTGFQATAYSFQYDKEESVLLEGPGHGSTSVPGGDAPSGRATRRAALQDLECSQGQYWPR